MTLKEYQKRAMATCLPESENFCYMMLNLVGEVGELASKVAKALRKGQIKMRSDADYEYAVHVDYQDAVAHDIELQKEAGDILWQLSGLCSVMGWDLEDIAGMNLAKLASRQERNVIDGDGDNR